MYQLITNPLEILDPKTYALMGEPDEPLYAYDKALEDLKMKIVSPIENIKVINFIVIPSATLDRWKKSIPELQAELAKFPYYRGSDIQPHIFRVDAPESDTAALLEATARIANTSQPAMKVDCTAISNLWTLVRIDGSLQAVLSGRWVNTNESV